MGKARPAVSRKIKKANDPVRAAISEALAADAQLEGLPSKETVTSLELIYGKKGIPTDDPFGREINHDAGHPARKMLTIVENGDGTTTTVLAPSLPLAQRTVTVMKDHNLLYPDMYLEIYVSGPPEDSAGFAQMFGRASCKKAKSIEEADLVVFTGGADVDPALYGEAKHGTTRYSLSRDTDDITLFMQCLDAGIPMLGICRGAQLLSVMHHGKLYQDVDGHYGDHAMYDHKGKGRIQKVSSTHHQMVMPNTANGMEIIATSAESRLRHLNPTVSQTGSHPDIEAFFYRDTCSIGIQGHPEYSGYNYFTKWSLELIEDLIINNPDIIWVNKNRRLDPALIAQRKQLLFSSGEVASIINSQPEAGAK